MAKKQDKRTKQQLLTELEALQAQGMYATLLESGNDGVVILQDGVCKFTNPVMLRMTGFSMEEVFDRPFVDFLSHPYKEMVDENYRKRMNGEAASQRYEIEMATKEGKLLSLEISASIVTYDGKPADMAIIRDITARKRAESAMIDSETRYRRLFESAKDGILIINAENGLIIDVNPFLQDLLGFSKTAFLGKELWEIGTFKDIIANKANFEELRRVGYIRYEDKPLKASDGRVLNVEFVSNLYEVDHQKIIQCNIRDITARKRAELESQQSREMMSKAEEIAKLGNWQFVVATQQRWWSPQMIKMMGFDLAKGTPAFEEFLAVIYPDDRNKIQDAFLRISRGEEPPANDFRVEDGDGSVRYFHAAYFCEKDAQGKAVRYIGTVQDTTERQQAEDALRQSDETLRILVEHSPAAIAVFDRDMKYVMVSRRYLADYGLGEQNLIGKSHYEIFPDMPERSKEAHKRCLAGAVESAEEEEFQRLSGEVDWVHWEIRPWYEADGGIGGVILFSEVITKRKRAEQALRESEERFRTLVESSPLGIAITSFSGKLVMANEAVLRMRGYSSREELMQATTAERYYDPADRERWLGLMKTEGVCRDFEIRLKRKDGSLFWASFNSIVVKAALGEPQIFNVINDITARKMAEDALRESEERFRSLVDDAPVGITISTPSGRIIVMNKALLKMHGYDTQAEFDSLPVSERYYNPADRERWLKLVREQGRAEGVEVHLKRKDGSAFWATFDTIPQLNNEGEQRFITIIQDITHRRQAEEALRQSEQSLRQLSEASFEGITIHEQGKIIMANAAFARLNGYELSEVIGMNVMDFTAPEARRQVTDRIRGGYTLPYESVGMRKDGTKYICEVHGTEIEYHGRRLRAAAVRDVTERKKAEDRLRESEEKYRDLVSRVNDGIFATDERGVLTFANKALADIHGVSNPDELIGKSFFDFVVPGQREDVVARFIQSLKTGNAPRNLEVSIMRRSGGVAHIQINAVPVLENGVPVGTTGVVRDVTEQRQIQGQLIAAGRLASIGQLVAGIAHEMNNPLTSVIGFSELLKNRAGLPNDIKEDIETVNREAKRTAGIIMGLLTFARQQKTGKELLNVNNIIQAVLQLRAYEQKVNNIEVETNFASDLPEVNGNAGQMQQVFINLVVNAEQSMTESHHKGKLMVVTEHIGDTVRISVADDGGGISLEDMPKLFTPFFTTKPVGKGTGLGLSICHGIVTEHGGRIYAASEPGKGATFVIELPTGK